MKKKVVIYGYTGNGKDVLYSLNMYEYEVVGVIDDAIEAQGRHVWNDIEIEVKDTKDINAWHYDYLVISAPWHYDEMMKHLNELGIDKNKIVVWKSTGELECVDQRIAYLHTCSDIIHKKNLKGACAELGVYKGEFSKYINYFFPFSKLYLFDTFEGFGDQQILPIEKEKARGNALNDFNDVIISEVLDKMVHKQQCIIRKGYFPNTINDTEEQFVFVSLDADLYQPIKDGLEYFYPRLVKGGYIFVHDYGGYDWPGVKMAVDEFCIKNEVTIVPIFDRCLSAIISK